MNILWLAWKDYTHPGHGGAEIVLRELMKRQVQEGHDVVLLTARHPGSAAQETLDGITIIRIGGNRYTHPPQALWYYLRHLRNKYDMVIETVNTAPYFGILFGGNAKRFVFYHQLAREIWYFETKKPLSHIGYYVIEPIATWLLSKARAPLITISDSTRQDLARFGWRPQGSHIISEGIEIEPAVSLSATEKHRQPTLLSLGAMRGMKRTIDQVKAFELAKQTIPNLQLQLAGDASGEYGASVLAYIENSPFRDDIKYLGRVSYEEKIKLMRRAHLIAVTSVKEGWGLIVTEAASQGTPAVVYDVDGLRDSVKDGVTGIVTKATPAALAEGIVAILQNNAQYTAIQKQAWEWSKHFTFDQSYQDFKHITEGVAL